MSKYINLEDAIEAYNQAVTNLVESEMEEFDLGDFTECSFNTTQIKLIARMIASLPTIEVSEDCISREWVQNKLTEYVKDYALNELDSWQNTIVEWIATDIEDAPSVVPQVPNEDCISRADAIKAYNEAVDELVKAEMEEFNLGDFTECSFNTTQLKLIARKIENAPSVVVRNNRTTAEPQTYITEDRDTQILDAWQVHHRNITTVEDEPTTEQSSKVGKWIACTKEGLPLTELGRKERQKWYGYKCSKCNFIYKGNALTESPFCQNCGADMRGEEE